MGSLNYFLQLFSCPPLKMGSLNSFLLCSWLNELDQVNIANLLFEFLSSSGDTDRPTNRQGEYSTLAQPAFSRVGK